MNELQIWFPTRDDYYSSWIYFKTRQTDIHKAIHDFHTVMKAIGVDLADMRPYAYRLWDENSNSIDCVHVKEIK